MGKKNKGLLDLVIELFADRIILLFLLAFVFVLKVITWILGFVPPEHQSIGFLLILCILAIILVLIAALVEEIPFFIRGHFRR